MNSDQKRAEVVKICDTIGRKLVAERMSVGKTAVGNAVSDGVFPARWYREMQALCSEYGLDCSDELFNFFRAAEDTKEAATQ